MMDDTRPLHVRVAEVLGCKPVFRKAYPGDREERWCCDCPNRGHRDPDLHEPWEDDPEIARYDLDWSATGPLIEQLSINLTRSVKAVEWYVPGDSWFANRSGAKFGMGATPLLAVCDWIVKNAEAFE
jgi:hypothetical protein